MFSIGFPLGDLLGSGHKLTTGVVSAVKGLKDDPRFFQITAPVQPGNSGGPILDNSGVVLGVLTASLVGQDAESVPQNVNFALRVDYLSLLLAQLTPAPAAALTAKPTSRSETIARLQHSIAQVRAFVSR